MDTLPSTQELDTLPIHHQVGFAGRCAMRVQHLFDDPRPDNVASESMFMIIKGIQSAEFLAANRIFIEAGDVTNEVTELGRRIAEVGNYSKNVGARVAFAVGYAAQSAGWARKALGSVSESAYAASKMMVEALTISQVTDSEMAAIAARRDFDALRAITNTTAPIDISEDGPLGPLWEATAPDEPPQMGLDF